jgi:hypothetical protein
LVTFALACSDDPSPGAPLEPDSAPVQDPTPEMSPNPDPEPTVEPGQPPQPEDPPCDEGTISIESPLSGQSFSTADDERPNEEGVQTQVNLVTSLPLGSLVTVENLTNGTSVGAITEADSVNVGGVMLSEGTNELRAISLVEGCLVTSQEVSVTLEGPITCGDDGDCPDGLLCEEGACQACDSECTSEADCGGRACIQGCFCEPGQHRFIMVEDLTNPVAGDSPGADIDAISVIKGADEFFAQRVEDASVSTSTNRFDDPNEVLGPPDADCQVQNFVSLGGSANGGYVIVSMGQGQQEVAVENGDTIKVYEIGSFLCDRFDDDPYQVSVSVTTDQGDFVELGQGGANNNLIPVSGL